jgi:hypothetical protein
METQPNSPLEDFVSIQLNDEALYFLEGAAKWSRFLAIIGMIGAGLIGLVGLLIMLFGSSLASQMPGFPLATGFIGFMYMIFGGIVAIPIVYLYRFASNALRALVSGDSQMITESFRYLRAHYRFYGILTAIVLGTQVIGLLIALVFGGLMAGFAL